MLRQPQLDPEIKCNKAWCRLESDVAKVAEEETPASVPRESSTIRQLSMNKNRSGRALEAS